MSLKEGDPVILQTDVPQLQGDELIVWRFGDEGKLIAKADIEAKSSPLYDETDERFRDRLKLNDQTGSLIITNTRTTDSGLYTAKISSNKQTSYKRFTVTSGGPRGSSPVISASGYGYCLPPCVSGQHTLSPMNSPQKSVASTPELSATAIPESPSAQPSLFTTSQPWKPSLSGKTLLLLWCQIKQSISIMVNLCFAGVFNAETDKTVSVMEGDSVTLNTNLTEILNDDTLLWLFGPKEFVISQITRKSVLTSFLVTDDVRFRGRLQVDQITGSLTIRNTRKRHSGQYKLTISREKITSRIFSVDVFGVVGETGGVKSVSVMEGDSVTLLETGTELRKGDEIKWWFEDLILIEFTKKTRETNDTECDVADGIFRNKLVLNVKTGDLIINNIRTIHSGLYKLQISRKNGKTEYMIFIVTVTVKEVPAKVGESVTLDPGLETLRSDLILWTFGAKNCLVIKAESGTTSISDRFRGRLELNHQTGSLTITNTTDTDFGLFQLQIINRDRTRYRRFNLTDTMNESTEEKPLLN
ncbi:uncharacterized protein LOC107667494 [Sinocyclocheilus anshuiensis]|uniref:uncharacterized protein LOC107667494 n=1 Tax=Sinocyclocheilus anshuiensis TaxID=1608454 RepID=UPI0007BA05A4|nr:PREDICTED: uncharacterized protein LOC107667494 [Sinocyclocheilus anshuiensis]